MLQFAYPLLMLALSEDRDELAYVRLARQSRAGLSSIILKYWKETINLI
jgi:hypothetical protein